MGNTIIFIHGMGVSKPKTVIKMPVSLPVYFQSQNIAAREVILYSRTGGAAFIDKPSITNVFQSKPHER